MVRRVHDTSYAVYSVGVPAERFVELVVIWGRCLGITINQYNYKMVVKHLSLFSNLFYIRSCANTLKIKRYTPHPRETSWSHAQNCWLNEAKPSLTDSWALARISVCYSKDFSGLRVNNTVGKCKGNFNRICVRAKDCHH